MTHLTSRAAEERRILLLDLVHTFAVRQTGKRQRDYAKVITSTETYRLQLLRRIRADDFFVVMLTARSTRYAEVTLKNIEHYTQGWRPDVAIFNDLEIEPPAFKGIALHRDVYPAFGSDRSRYFALESNAATRRLVYQQEGIVVQTWESYIQGGEQSTMNW